MKSHRHSILTGIGYTLCTHMAVWGVFLLFYLGLRLDEVSWFSTVILLCISIGVYFYLQKLNNKPLSCLFSAGITHLLLYVGEGILISLIDQAKVWHILDPIGSLFFKGLAYSVIALTVWGSLFAMFVADAIRISVIRFRATPKKAKVD